MALPSTKPPNQGDRVTCVTDTSYAVGRHPARQRVGFDRNGRRRGLISRRRPASRN